MALGGALGARELHVVRLGAASCSCACCSPSSCAGPAQPAPLLLPLPMLCPPPTHNTPPNTPPTPPTHLPPRLSHYLSDKKKAEKSVLEMAGKLTQQLQVCTGPQ